MGWWGSRRPASVAFSPSTPSDGVSTGSGPGSEGTRGRRNSLDRPNSGLSATRKNPEEEANALLRGQFLHHLVTQVKLSSVVRLRCAACAPATVQSLRSQQAQSRTARVRACTEAARPPDAAAAVRAICRHYHGLWCARYQPARGASRSGCRLGRVARAQRALRCSARD